MTTTVAITTAGKVEGVATPHGVAFFGIPFAEPPFGEHRFAAPVPASSWDGVRLATEPAPTSPQPAAGFTLIPEPVIDGGDAPGCLVVNVHTPDLGAAGLPVLVWVHGGGFVSGTPSSPWYHGDRFNRDGVVVVSVGYRLGSEGFLSIPGAPDNRGVSDWLLGLRWVQDNIANFGGDPARVTVGGQSAGGAATMLLATLPQTAGMMRAAIPMSGSAFPAPSMDAVRRLTDKIAAHLGVPATRDGLAGVRPADLVAAQIAATSGGAPFSGELNFFPYVDGEVVATSPIEAIGAGAAATMPLLIGATREETTALARLTPLTDEQETAAYAGLKLSPEGTAHYRSGAGVGQAVTDRMFRMPALRIAEARSGGPAPTFSYDFQWATPQLGGLGAVHCLDLPFVWDVLDDDHVKVVAGDDPPPVLAQTMHAAWVRFITDGDPGWAPFDTVTRTSMVFDETSKPVQDVMADVRGFWP